MVMPLSKSHKIQEKTSVYSDKNVTRIGGRVTEKISDLNLDPKFVGCLFGYCGGALLGFNASIIKPHLPSSGIISYIFNHQHPDFGESTPILGLAVFGAMIGMVVGIAIERSEAVKNFSLAANAAAACSHRLTPICIKLSL